MRSVGAPRLLLMVVVVHQVAVAASHDPAAACAAKAVTECVINRPMRNQQVGAAVRALEDLTRGGQGLRAHSIWRARPLATNLTHCDCTERHEHHQPLRPGAGTSGCDREGILLRKRRCSNHILDSRAFSSAVSWLPCDRRTDNTAAA